MRRMMLFVGAVLVCVAVYSVVYAQDAEPAAAQPVVGQPVRLFPKVAPTKISVRGDMKEPQAMPLYVYNNSLTPPAKSFAASGYMGDVGDIRVMGGYTNMYQVGVPCLKVMYAAAGDMAWGGVMWQNPANNWGDADGGYNLTKAKQLSFWARGEKGGESVEFKLGGMAAKHPDSDSVSTGDVLLKNLWTQYTLDLSAANLSYISAGFGFVLKQDANPNGCTFYLDDVKYE